MDLIKGTVYRVHHGGGYIDWRYTSTERKDGWHNAYRNDRAVTRHYGINLSSGREVVLKSTVKIKRVVATVHNPQPTTAVRDAGTATASVTLKENTTMASTQVTPDMSPAMVAMIEELNRLKAENAKMKAKTTGNRLSLRVSEKGAVSIYGVGRFPVTLYPEQIRKVLAIGSEIEAFIVANKSALKFKDTDADKGTATATPTDTATN